MGGHDGRQHGRSVSSRSTLGSFVARPPSLASVVGLGGCGKKSSTSGDPFGARPNHRSRGACPCVPRRVVIRRWMWRAFEMRPLVDRARRSVAAPAIRCWPRGGWQDIQNGCKIDVKQFQARPCSRFRASRRSATRYRSGTDGVADRDRSSRPISRAWRGVRAMVGKGVGGSHHRESRSPGNKTLYEAKDGKSRHVLRVSGSRDTVVLGSNEGVRHRCARHRQEGHSTNHDLASWIGLGRSAHCRCGPRVESTPRGERGALVKVMGGKGSRPDPKAIIASFDSDKPAPSSRSPRSMANPHGCQDTRIIREDPARASSEMAAQAKSLGAIVDKVGDFTSDQKTWSASRQASDPDDVNQPRFGALTAGVGRRKFRRPPDGSFFPTAPRDIRG